MQQIEVGPKKILSLLALFPMAFVALGATIAAAIIAFINGHIILGLLCLRWIKIKDKESNRVLSIIRQFLIVALSILYSEWAVLILAIAIPLMLVFYTKIVVKWILKEVLNKDQNKMKTTSYHPV